MSNNRCPPAVALPPHPPLSRHYQSPEERLAYISRLFDASAASYDRINRLMSLGTGERYRRQALARAGVGRGHRVLDIGSGTGVMAFYEQSMVGPQGSVLAVDPSLPMLQIARARGVKRLVAGRAERIPLADCSVDFISLGHALRHAADLNQAFAEFHRLLRPGGILLILEVLPHANPWGYRVLKLYLKYLVPFATSLLTANRKAGRLMSYYWDSLDQCVPPERILTALRAQGFADAELRIRNGVFGDFRAFRAA
jgi:demethylmenaquinone methyltransferase/2-methoxy-6-polyprenyl-1,4-benzoquinol methylase